MPKKTLIAIGAGVLSAFAATAFLSQAPGALMLVYLNALRIWLGDETGTMDKVMAQLDKSLARLESLAGSFLARRLELRGPPDRFWWRNS